MKQQDWFKNRLRTPSGNEIKVSVKNLVELISKKQDICGSKAVLIKPKDSQIQQLKINQPWTQRLRATRMTEFTTKTTTIARVACVSKEDTSKCKEVQLTRRPSLVSNVPESENFVTPPATPTRPKTRMQSQHENIAHPTKKQKIAEEQEVDQTSDSLNKSSEMDVEAQSDATTDQEQADHSKNTENTMEKEEAVATPKVMDLSMVVNMFQRLEERMLAMENKQQGRILDSQGEEVSMKEYVDEQIQNTQREAAAVREVSNLRKDLEYHKKLVKIQTGEIQKLHDGQS